MLKKARKSRKQKTAKWQIKDNVNVESLFSKVLIYKVSCTSINIVTTKEY